MTLKGEAVMKFAFVSCNHPVKHPSQPGWLDLAERKPEVLLLIGDNTYVEDHMWQLWFGRPALTKDDESYAIYLHERYVKQWAVPEFRQCLAEHRARQGDVLGTIDDHDFLGNDLAVTPELAMKAKIARALFRQFIEQCNGCIQERYPGLPDWRSDPDPGMNSGLGLATSRRYGDVLVALLDNRSFREDPGQNTRALGERQIKWLQSQLNSDQRVSLVFSGSPLTRGSKWLVAGSTLSQYPTEFRELRSLYHSYASRNIVHIGGDLHYNDYKGRDEHVDFVEVCSSGMGTGYLPFSSHQYGNFGIIEVSPQELRIQTYGADPHRNYDHRHPI